jgi:hypothetical protein
MMLVHGKEGLMQNVMEWECERPEDMISKCRSTPTVTGSGLLSAKGGYQMLEAGRAYM